MDTKKKPLINANKRNDKEDPKNNSFLRVSSRPFAVKRFLFVMTLPLCCWNGWSGTLTAQSRIPIDGYAAMVNDRMITFGEVLTLARSQQEELRYVAQGDTLKKQIEESVQEALNALIERALILEDFEAEAGTVPEQLVDNQVNEIIREQFDGNRLALLKTLESEGVHFADWRDQIRERIVVVLLRRQHVYDQVRIPPTAVRRAYEDRLEDDYYNPDEAHLRMIIIHKGENENDHKIKGAEAERLVRELTAGEDFGTVARSASEGGKADEGGDWGWVEVQQLRSELVAAIERLQPGELSDVIETEKEYYIIKVEGKKSAFVIPFEDVKHQIEQGLRAAEEKRLYDRWMARLKKRHVVKIYRKE